MRRSEKKREREDEDDEKKNVGKRLNEEEKKSKDEEAERKRLNEKWMEAAKRGDAEAVKEMLKDERVDLQYVEGGENALEVASWGGHAKVVRTLLEDGRIDPSHDDNYAVGIAALYGRAEVVRLLLADKRVDPSVDDNWAVRGAAGNGHLEVVRLLLADPRVDAIEAIEYCDWSVIHILLEDERFGILKNRALFEEHKPRAVEKYDAFCAERSERCFAAMWCMKEIRMGWADLRYPIGDIMVEEKMEQLQEDDSSDEERSD
jgi:hypothetical protein